MGQTLRILYSSDVHGTVLGHSYADGSAIPGSFARLSTLIARLRNEADGPCLVIDGGDTIEGSPLTSFHERSARAGASPASRALAAIGYDYLVPGNHDFSYGLDSFSRHVRAAEAALLCCNIESKHETFACPHAICEFEGRRIALVGACTHFVPRWEIPAHYEGLKFLDAFESVRKQLAYLRNEAAVDYVVVIYHGGFERDPLSGAVLERETGENQAWRMLSEIEGIDLLLTGHTHLPICDRAAGLAERPVWCIQPGVRGQYLACIDIDLGTFETTATLISADSSVAEDSALTALVAHDESLCQSWLDEALGESLIDLRIHDELEAKINKAALVSFLNLVQLDATKAQLSATALFSGATGFGREISMRDLVSTYTYSNTLVVKRVNGAQLKDYLEKCAEYFAFQDGHIIVAPDFADPPKDFNYDMVDGIEYTIDVSAPRGQRISDLRFHGQTVDNNDSFELVVNNYRAAGGGDFPMIAEAETISEKLVDMVELIADYINNHSPVSFEHTHNISVIATHPKGQCTEGGFS